MKEERMLYQIKELEKMIFRALLLEQNGGEELLPCKPPTPTQMQILEYILKHQQEEVFQKDLEEVLNLRRATVSGVLQTMEKNHLIERVVSNQDARVKKIILNPKAQAMFRQKEKKMQELEKIVIQGIEEHDLESFSSVLKRMKENLKKYLSK